MRRNFYRLTADGQSSIGIQVTRLRAGLCSNKRAAGPAGYGKARRRAALCVTNGGEDRRIGEDREGSHGHGGKESTSQFQREIGRSPNDQGSLGQSKAAADSTFEATRARQKANMRNSNSLTWRQVVTGSLIALGLVLAIAHIGKAQTAKADRAPPSDWREQSASREAPRSALPAHERHGQQDVAAAENYSRKPIESRR